MTLRDRLQDLCIRVHHWAYHAALRLVCRMFGTLIVDVHSRSTTVSPRDRSKPMILYNVKLEPIEPQGAFVDMTKWTPEQTRDNLARLRAQKDPT
jgi:hypothetical protein